MLSLPRGQHVILQRVFARLRCVVVIRGQACWLAALTAIYLGLRVWSFAGIAGHASSFPDTPEYEAVARRSVFSLDFWTWFKPWGTSLLWKLVPGPTDTSAPIAQWLISVVAWLILAYVLFYVFDHPPVKFAGFALVLSFSLVPAVAVWDGALLSESLTLSLAALLLAALLLLVQALTWKRAAAVLLLALLLAGTRASNGYLVPFVLIPVGVVILRRSRPFAVALIVGAVAITAMTYETSNVRQWQLPLAEVIAGRVLHKPSEEAYFVARGMPVRATLEPELWANRTPLSRLERDRRLDWFLPWFNRDGRATYRDYLLSHPSDSIMDPIQDLPSMVSPSSSTNDLQGLPLMFYAAKGYRSSLPGVIARILYPTSASLLIIWAILSVAVMGAFAAMELGRIGWMIPLLGLLSCVPHAIIVWNGDDTSLGRHALLLAVLLRLSLLVTLLYIADAYMMDSARTTPATRLRLGLGGFGKAA